MALPVIHVEGSHYEIGYKTGVAIKAGFQEYATNSKQLKNDILPFLDTELGQKLYDGLLSTGKEWYPQYVEELQGIADGSGVEFRKIFAMNIDMEVFLEQETNAMEGSHDKGTITGVPGMEGTHDRGTDDTGMGGTDKRTEDDPGRCTDVMINTESLRAIGHTEDYERDMRGYCYIVDAIIHDKSGKKHNVPEERFTSHCFPGRLPGVSFSFNGYGIVTTIDSLFSLSPLPYDALALCFQNRTLLSARNRAEFELILQATGKGVRPGHCVNASFPDSDKMYSYEISMNSNKDTAAHVQRTVIGQESSEGHCDFKRNYWHANGFRATPNRVEFRPIGCVNRELRLKELPSPNSLDDIRNILSDVKYGSTPIYRSKDLKEGKTTTLATAIFNLTDWKMEVYVDGPANQGLPTLVMDIPH